MLKKKIFYFSKILPFSIPLLLIFVLFNPLSAYSQEKEYTVAGKDVLDITVYEEEDLSKTLRVTEDGFITFPLLGQVRVGGLTTAQIEKKMEKLLKKDYLVNPQVSVMVKEFASRKVFVLGAVKEPGSYKLVGRTTILELISQAGGVNIGESGKNLILLRPEPEIEGKEREIITRTINLDELLKSGNTSLNLVVQNKDTIYIPKADTVYVFGEVKNPGPVKLEKDTTIVEAISKAGGFTRLAAKNRTRVVRVIEGKETKIRVKMDDITKGDQKENLTLKPEDIIVIPERYF